MRVCVRERGGGGKEREREREREREAVFKNGHIRKNLTQNGESQRSILRTQEKKKKHCQRALPNRPRTPYLLTTPPSPPPPPPPPSPYRLRPENRQTSI